MLHPLILVKTHQPCMTGVKLCLWSPTFIFFPRNTSYYLYLLTITIRVVFLSNIFIKPYNINENSQPCMAGDWLLGKFVFLKQILKLKTQFPPWIVFRTKIIFLSSHHVWLTKTNWFLFCVSLSYVLNVVQPVL